MSYEEWLAWDYEGGLTEWVNGEVIFHMAATAIHQRLIIFLSAVLSEFARIYKLGRVLTAPYPMRAEPAGNGREPDLIFVVAEHLERLTEQQLLGAADLVIEIVSDDSTHRDRVTKFDEYEEAGVREYWLIDPRPMRRKKQRADFYVLDDQGQYQPVPIGKDRIYRSTVLLNFWLNVDWLWADEPNALTALAQLVGTEKLLAAMQGNK